MHQAGDAGTVHRGTWRSMAGLGTRFSWSSSGTVGPTKLNDTTKFEPSRKIPFVL